MYLQVSIICLVLVTVDAQSTSLSPNETSIQRPPTSFFIHCADIRNITSANAMFEAYMRQYPEVNRTNVNGSAGKLVRDEFMKCDGFCTAPLGDPNPDLSGIGVFYAVVVQFVITIVLCPILPMVVGLDKEKASEPLQSICTTLYNTCVVFSISIEIASLVWSGNDEAQIFQNVFFNFLSELSFASLLVAHTLIGKHTRKPTRSFLAALVAMAIFIVLKAHSVLHEEEMIKQSLQFYDTIGVDCSKFSEQREFVHIVLQRDLWHHFSMVVFFTFVSYFFWESRVHWKSKLVGCFRLFPRLWGWIKNPNRVKEQLRQLFEKFNDAIRKQWRQSGWGFVHPLGIVLIYLLEYGIKTWHKQWRQRGWGLAVIVLVYLLAYATGGIMIWRVYHFRETFQRWYEQGEESWVINLWGYGQVLPIVLLVLLIWEIAGGLIPVLRVPTEVALGSLWWGY